MLLLYGMIESKLRGFPDLLFGTIVVVLRSCFSMKLVVSKIAFSFLSVSKREWLQAYAASFNGGSTSKIIIGHS